MQGEFFSGMLAMLLLQGVIWFAWSQYQVYKRRRDENRID